MNLKRCFSYLLGLALLASPLAAQPYGITDRTTNTQLVLTDPPADAAGPMRVERVFPRLSFGQSVLLLQCPDGSGRFFHLDQRGIIRVFPDKADPDPATELEVFLDISDRVSRSGGEEGLLGMAFDPDFATSGDFYLYYSAADPRRSVLSRFNDPNPGDNQADPAAETVLLEVAQPYSNHNGGMIAFGPDDMLYVALGDGGSGGDPDGNGQNPETLLGSILRLDVLGPPDPGLQYAIPPDNPFVADPPTTDSRREIYAWGLRNPYRFSFDTLNGRIYAGDVGQNRVEEIDLIEAGGNYGWNYYEGSQTYSGTPPTGQEFLFPIAEYSHTENGGSASVTGGYVYYGDQVPELYGHYIFGDYVSKRVWSLSHDGTTLTQPMTLLAETGLTLTGFGQDATGEVYLLDYYGGIYVLRPESGGGGSSFPTRLSDLPALFEAGAGRGHEVDGIYPYEPMAPLWSDHARKERYFALPDFDFPAPDYARIGWTEIDGWNFPDRTVLIKNFLLPLDLARPDETLQRIETRLLVRFNGQWQGFSYEWNEEQTDAQLLTSSKTRRFELLDASGQAFDYDWLYPSRSQCLSCHTAATNRVLGLRTVQLNGDFQYPSSGVTDNQLRTLDYLNLFDPAPASPPDQLDRMPRPFDSAAALEPRARAYLAANCAMCHRPGGTAPTAIDLRWETDSAAMNAIDVVPQSGELGIANSRIIAPGAFHRSTLGARMIRLDPAVRMPPLASSLTDPEGSALLAEWINSLAHVTEAQLWLGYE